MASVFEEIRVVVERLSPSYQLRVLEFARELNETNQIGRLLPTTSLPQGTPGSALLRFSLPLEDVEAIENALEDCELDSCDSNPAWNYTRRSRPPFYMDCRTRTCTMVSRGY